MLLGFGYLCGRIKYLSDPMADGLNAYALKIGVPVLLLMAMYRLDFSRAFHLEMLIGFYAGAFTCFYSGIFLSRIFWRRRPGESVAVGFCAFFSNTVLMGLPIAQLAFGEEIMAPVFGIIALHASVLYITGITTMELARRDGEKITDSLKSAVVSIAGNSLMAGIVAGLLLNVFGVHLPQPAETALDMIAATAIPISLIGIGVALNRYAIKSELTESLMISALSLLLHPAITFTLTYYVFELDAVFVQAAVVLAAMPPGMNVYIFASLYNRAIGLSASVIVIANLIAVLTASAWLVLIQGIG